MNAHSFFLRGMAMLGKPRAKQSVHIVSKRFNRGRSTRYIVLVTPDGAERGSCYEVFAAGLQCLEDGMTPEQLDLEPHVPDEADEDEFEENFLRRIGAF